MRVLNVHERRLAAAPAAVGALLDGLGSRHDRLWPRDRWPAMRLDRPLQVGAAGGHGPIRYRVERYEPGRLVEFRFLGPSGFRGSHRFEIGGEADGTTRLAHVVEMTAAGWAVLGWVLALRPLHDALLEDCLDSAEERLLGRRPPRRWTAWVRALRFLSGPGRSRRRAGTRQND